MRDRFAALEYRAIRAANVLSMATLRRPVTRTTTPSWYRRAGINVFHAAVSYLRTQYSDVLRAASMDMQLPESERW
jgi:hypothetical protein